LGRSPGALSDRRGLGLQHGHHPHERGPVAELGAADAVIDKDVAGIDLPALLLRVGLGVLDLSRDRLLLATVCSVDLRA
jgi:hypothetical protein